MAPYTLLQHGTVWGLPSSCTTCIYVQTYLKLAAVPYDVYDCNNQPDSELPLLQVPARFPSPFSPAEVSSSASDPSLSASAAPSTSAAGSSSSDAPQQAVSSNSSNRDSASPTAARTIEVIESNPLQWLKDNEGIDLDSPLLDKERVELQAFSALLDPLLSDATEYTLWMEADNHKEAIEAYCGHLPWPVTTVLGWLKHRTVLQCFKQGGMKEVKDSSRLYSRVADAYKALSVRLGNSKYFFAERPTSVDAALFAHLIFHLRAPLSVAPMKEAMMKYPNLVKYAETMETELFQCPQGAVRDPPLFTRTDIRTPTGSKGNLAKIKEERNMWRKNALFVGAQIAGIVGVLGLATLTMVSDVEMEEEDMEDDDEEEE